MTVKSSLSFFIFITLVACNDSNEKAKQSSGSHHTATAAAGDSSTHGHIWDESYREAFMTQCIGGSKGKMPAAKAKNYCNCMLQQLEKKYPVADSANTISTAAMIELAKNCLQ